MRKVQWIAKDAEGKLLGIFPTRKKVFYFFGEDQVVLTKLVWNGFYHSEKPLEYDPYQTGKVDLFEPMF